MAWEQVPEKAWQPSGAPVTGYPQSSSYGQPGGYQVMPVLDCQAAKSQIRLDVVQPHNCSCVGCAAIPAVSAPAAAAVLSTGPRRLPWWPGASHPGFWCSHQTLLSFLSWLDFNGCKQLLAGIAGPVWAVWPVPSWAPAAGHVCPAAAEARRRRSGRRGVPGRLVSRFFKKKFPCTAMCWAISVWLPMHMRKHPCWVQ